MKNKFVGILIFGCVLFAPAAFARRDNQFLIPPPPPTPCLVMPPEPIALPYSEAYANYKVPAAAIPYSQPKPLPLTYSPAPHMVRRAPNYTGLSLTDAGNRGFGKPRLPYNAGFGPGAALATPY